MKPNSNVQYFLVALITAFVCVLSINSFEMLIRKEYIYLVYGVLVLVIFLLVRFFSGEKKLESEHKELTLRLQLAGKISAMGVWSWDINTNAITCEANILQLYDMDPTVSESDYKTLSSKLHPSDKKAFNEEIELALSGKKEYDTEFRILSNDTTIRYVKAAGIVERDSNGRPIRMIITNRDITERKNRETQLYHSESISRSILDSLSSHLVVLDSYGVIVAVSESWRRFAVENGNTTFTNAGIGTNYFSVFKKAIDKGDILVSEALDGIWSVLEGEQTCFYLEYPCHSPYKKSWFGMRVTRSQSKELMLVIEHKDITNVKLAEQERERITYDLIQRNQNMEQFSYLVSHNLRGPLANILGFAGLLEVDKNELLTRIDLVNAMFQSAYKMDEVVKDLNEILQVKTQLFDTKESVCFNDVVKEVSVSIGKALKNQNVIIISDFDTVDTFFSVKRYMYSIFYNLIYNSIKYQKPGVAARIEINSTVTAKGIQLVFKDNGLGIDLEKNGDNIFGLYKRFHLSKEGKGMGLFMVKTQVETLGGRISVVSEVNKGTEFTIEFDY